jgi:hypothetical protein
VNGVGQSDLAGLSRRKWYLMAAGWSLLLLVPAIVALTSDEPLAVRLLQLLAVLGYAACYVLGLYEGASRGSPVFSVALLLVMAALFLVLAGMGSGVYTVAFLVVGVDHAGARPVGDGRGDRGLGWRRVGRVVAQRGAPGAT